MAAVVLFLFAHQDDEFGAFHLLDDCRRRGQRVVCAYLTRGARGCGARRNEESRRVLAELGVDEDDIRFAGDELGIDDATLPEALDRAGAWIAHWFASFEGIGNIFVTAWEGGHHDHDALHALTVEVARRRKLLPVVRQFALYNRHRCPGPLFRVLSPLAANGPVQLSRIPLGRRLAYLRLCLRYPSQAKTWVGLFPFVLLHYLWSGTQAVQAADPARIGQRPHAGKLYYEHRHFYRWDRMCDRLHEWSSRA